MKELEECKEWVVVNRVCVRALSALRKFVLETRTKVKSRKGRILLSMLMRHYSNLQAVAILTKLSVLKHAPVVFKLPIGLLLRNCFMDSLLGLYLCSVDDDNAEEIADVLNLDYAKALFDEFEVCRDKIADFMPYEDKFIEHIYTMSLEDTYLHNFVPNKNPSELENKGERFIWRFKKKSDVRTLVPESDVKNELNVKTIFESLKTCPDFAESARNLYAYYKFFSQYEHFSENGFGDSIADSANDNVNFEKALLRLEESITMIQKECEQKCICVGE